MNPRFKIDEVVILQSESMPHCNGEYIVEAINRIGDSIQCRLTGDIKIISGGNGKFGYFLHIPIKHEILPSEVSWAESALKKKHFPSSESFDTMMSSLKQPQKV